jgi:glycoside/pentoside/hexuronide:cation symporter, GPH family
MFNSCQVRETSIDVSVAALHRAHQSLKAAVGSKEIVVSETGCLSQGEPLGQAIPSAENAARYALNFVSWARAENVKSIYFEAIDEAWKARFEGERGKHWGIFDANLNLKPGSERVFNGETVPDNC